MADIIFNGIRLRPTRFTFCSDDCPVFSGFTDGTYWNGFINVQVTTETIRKIIGWSAKDRLKYGGHRDEFEGQFDSVVLGENGLHSLAYGFATEEVTD